MSRPTPPTYKTRNWPSYNKALKRRGSLTIWFDPAMTWEAVPTGKRGRQRDYSDAAIQTCLTLKVLFGMALRQTTGFVESLLQLIGLDWEVPDFGTLSRRQKTLKVNIPYRGSDGPLHPLIDIEPGFRHWFKKPWRGGLKVEGEGEWNARKCHDAIAARGAAALAIGLEPMAPQWLAPAPQERQALEARHSRCHRMKRNPADVETRWSNHLATMERRPPTKSRRNQKATYVKLLGQRLSARDFDRQVAEFQVRVAVLNGFTALGTPVTEVSG